jgi:hypothetical protein
MRQRFPGPPFLLVYPRAPAAEIRKDLRGASIGMKSESGRPYDENICVKRVIRSRSRTRGVMLANSRMHRP